VKDQHTKYHTANKAYQAAAKAVAENKDPKKAGDLEGAVAKAKEGLEAQANALDKAKQVVEAIRAKRQADAALTMKATLEKNAKERGARKATLDAFTKKLTEDKGKNDDFKKKY